MSNHLWRMYSIYFLQSDVLLAFHLAWNFTIIEEKCAKIIHQYIFSCWAKFFPGMKVCSPQWIPKLSEPEKQIINSYKTPLLVGIIICILQKPKWSHSGNRNCHPFVQVIYLPHLQLQSVRCKLRCHKSSIWIFLEHRVKEHWHDLFLTCYCLPTHLSGFTIWNIKVAFFPGAFVLFIWCICLLSQCRLQSMKALKNINLTLSICTVPLNHPCLNVSMLFKDFNGFYVYISVCMCAPVWSKPDCAWSSCGCAVVGESSMDLYLLAWLKQAPDIPLSSPAEHTAFCEVEQEAGLRLCSHLPPICYKSISMWEGITYSAIVHSSGWSPSKHLRAPGGSLLTYTQFLS